MTHAWTERHLIGDMVEAIFLPFFLVDKKSRAALCGVKKKRYSCRHNVCLRISSLAVLGLWLTDNRRCSGGWWEGWKWVRGFGWLEWPLINFSISPISALPTQNYYNMTLSEQQGHYFSVKENSSSRSTTGRFVDITPRKLQYVWWFWGLSALPRACV